MIRQALLFILLAACTRPAPATETPSADPATNPSDEAATSGLAPSETSTPVGEPPANADAAVRIKHGEQETAFSPNMPDSRFDPGTDGARLYVYGPGGWSFIMRVPTDYSETNAQFAAHDLAATVATDGTEDFALDGRIDIDAFDPSSGRVALTFRGGTAADGSTPVEVDIDATVTPLGE